MTVRELIRALEQCDPTLLVYLTHPDSGHVDDEVSGVKEKILTERLQWQRGTLVSVPMRPWRFVQLR